MLRWLAERRAKRRERAELRAAADWIRQVGSDVLMGLAHGDAHARARADRWLARIAEDEGAWIDLLIEAYRNRKAHQ